MNIDIAKLLDQLIKEAKDRQVFAYGRLVSPVLRGELAPDVPGIPGDAWLLSGETHPEMQALIAAGQEPETDVTVLEAQLGVLYLVVRLRVREWEHRFVVPLCAASSREFVAAMAQSGISSLLKSSGNPKICVQHIVRSATDTSVPRLLRANIPDLFPDGGLLAVETIATSMQLLEPAVLPGMRAFKGVTKVCVTTVYPEETIAQMLQLSSAGQTKH